MEGEVLDIAWSSDGLLIAARSLYHGERIKTRVRVWNTAAKSWILEVDDTDGKDLLFDAANSHCLYTSAGTFDMRSGDRVESAHPVEVPSQSEGDYSLNDDLSWITYQGKNLIFLPLEYRSHIWLSSGATVAIGCPSGQVMILSFSKDGPELP